MEKIYLSRNVFLGCDPELFVKKGAHVIGSEKIIPRDGIDDGYGKIIRDGIQLEFNPSASYCRELLASSIASSFFRMRSILGPGVKISTDVTVPITKKEMESLSAESKQFGCNKSFNAYDDEVLGTGITDASKYYFRSAGGHVHLGGAERAVENVLKDKSKHKTIIKVLDIMLGNTMVLLDRSTGNIERRKHYGKAGEYRTPKYGLEYRTLSNFWLMNYTLMSMVFGIARHAVNIVVASTPENNYADKLIALVDEKDIRNAINNNDYELALKNFNKIKKFVVSTVSDAEMYTPFRKSLLSELEYFLTHPVEKFINVKNPLEHWSVEYRNRYEYNVYGIESFLGGKIRPIMLAEKNKK